MSSPRTNATRRAAAVGLACGLCLAFAVGCAKKSGPAPGGASGSKADKARKEAEKLAVNSFNAAASSQARAVPELVKHRDRQFLWGFVTYNTATKDWDLGPSKTSAVKTEVPAPAQASTPAPPKVPEIQIVKGPPTPKAPPRPGLSPTVIRERVVSTVPYANEKEAEADALAQACDLVERKLAALDPPVRYKPSVGAVESDFIRKDSRTVRQPDAEEKETFARYGITGNPVYVEYDVEVTADQVRELRSQERVSAGMRVLGMLLAVALAGFLFLRADEWTKGYLTSWLAIGAVALAGGAAAALIVV